MEGFLVGLGYDEIEMHSVVSEDLRHPSLGSVSSRIKPVGIQADKNSISASIDARTSPQSTSVPNAAFI
jgi:hypothetical protein